MVKDENPCDHPDLKLDWSHFSWFCQCGKKGNLEDMLDSGEFDD